MFESIFRLAAVVALTAWPKVGLAAADDRRGGPREAEETYELRLERILNTKGLRAMVEYLARELKEHPTPYVKAWYANYLLYGEALGVKDVEDPARGFVLARESCNEGSLFGLELVGRAYGDGRGTAQNPALAVGYLRGAVEQGRDTAMSELGKFYFFGVAVPKDRAAAEKLYLRGAWLGAYGPLHTLAQWWEDPRYTQPPNHEKALEIYYLAGEFGSADALKSMKAWAQKGDALAQKYVHLDFVVSTNEGYDALPSKLREAVRWLEAHAAPDDWPVQLALAEVMTKKTLVVYDPRAAKAKLERAVQAGVDDARALQAEMAWDGIGQPADKAGAVKTWQELADRDNARALNRLGALHYWGEAEKFGIPRDSAKAFALCRRSADLGYWAGQLNVAKFYTEGIGVPVSYFLAAKYYGILEDRRYPFAHKMKERVLAYVKD
jgi:TPR repeat protein